MFHIVWGYFLYICKLWFSFLFINIGFAASDNDKSYAWIFFPELIIQYIFKQNRSIPYIKTIKNSRKNMKSLALMLLIIEEVAEFL